ncbi:hypothetical protein HZS_5819 [Henneguya salminicola]|nr:hypothetical protein HZS_5819 [Henneguya salminicola]
MFKLSNHFMDLFLSVLNIRDGKELALLVSIDQKFNHSPVFHKNQYKIFDVALNEYVPSFLINILESIRENRYLNLEDLGMEILHAVRGYDQFDQGHPFFKTSAIVKRTIKAKIENIKAGENLTSTKRTHKITSYYEEIDHSSEQYHQIFQVFTLFSIFDISFLIPNPQNNEILNAYNDIVNKNNSIGVPILTCFNRLPSRRLITQNINQKIP